jgi:hypothetical protein
MKRAIAPFALVLGVTFAGAAVAQDSTIKTKTKVEGDDAQTVTYTGCVRTGTQTQSYVLNNVVPVSKSTEVSANAAGMPTETTSTTYALVPGDTVQITEYVGHKVEVTGMLVPKGEMKTETETKVGDDTTKHEKIETESDAPQFRVISIRNLAERCE